MGTEKMYETEKGEKQNVNFWLTLRTYQALSERGALGSLLTELSKQNYSEKRGRRRGLKSSRKFLSSLKRKFNWHAAAFRNMVTGWSLLHTI
jgi:hypothetical protein